MPFKGNVRQEDLMTQSTQGLLGERAEQLGVSDRGVIMFRRIVLKAIESALRGGALKGMLSKDRADDIIRLDTSVGVREKIAR